MIFFSFFFLLVLCTLDRDRFIARHSFAFYLSSSLYLSSSSIKKKFTSLFLQMLWSLYQRRNPAVLLYLLVAVSVFHHHRHRRLQPDALHCQDLAYSRARPAGDCVLLIYCPLYTHISISIYPSPCRLERKGVSTRLYRRRSTVSHDLRRFTRGLGH